MRNLRWRTAILVLASFVACALVYVPTLSGALLSDDYAVLAALSDWSQEGHLLRALVSKFYSALDSPSFYYRPVSMASFGFNFALTSGAWMQVDELGRCVGRSGAAAPVRAHSVPDRDSGAARGWHARLLETSRVSGELDRGGNLDAPR